MSTDLRPVTLPINSTLLDRLKESGTVKTVPPETVILDENDHIRSVPIVLRGSVKVLRLDEDGKEILLYYIQPGESCIMSFLGAMCNGTSKLRAVTEEEAVVLMLPVHKALDLVKENSQWLEYIFQLYNKRFEELLDVVNGIAFQNVDDRLWELLLKKVKMQQSNDLTITHQQIADELGTAREVVSRLLKRLERDNKVLLFRNKISVIGNNRGN